MKGDTYLSVNDSQRFKRCQTKYKYKGGMSKNKNTELIFTART